MKLTNKIREEIIIRVLDEKQRAYNAEKDVIIKDIASRALSIKWGSIPKDLISIANKIPRSWLVQSSKISIYNGNRHINDLDFSEDYFPLAFVENSYRNEKRVMLNLSELVPVENELIKVLDEFNKKDQSYNNYKAELRKELKSLLYAASTDIKLLLLWPEGEKYYKEVLSSNVCTLLTVNVDRVNNLMAER